MKYLMIFVPIIIAFSIGGCTTPSTPGNEPIVKTQFIIHPIGKVVKEDDKTMIVLDEKYQPGLSGLEKHSHVTVVYWFDSNRSQR